MRHLHPKYYFTRQYWRSYRVLLRDCLVAGKEAVAREETTLSPETKRRIQDDHIRRVIS